MAMNVLSVTQLEVVQISGGYRARGYGARGNQFDYQVGHGEENILFERIAKIPSLKRLAVYGGNNRQIPFQLVRTSSTLTSLDLIFVSIIPRQLQALLAGNATLQSLSLNDIRPLNATWNQLLQGLARGLKANSSLETLQLPNYPDEDPYVPIDLSPMQSVFAEASTTPNISNLKELVFEPEPYLELRLGHAESLVPLLSLKPFPKLKKLTVAMDLEQDQLPRFVDALWSNPGLEELDFYLISEQSISDVAGSRFVRDLVGLDSLKKLYYQQDRCWTCSRAAAQGILDNLSNNTSIEYASLTIPMPEDGYNEQEFGRAVEKICFDHVLLNCNTRLARIGILRPEYLAPMLSKIQRRQPFHYHGNINNVVRSKVSANFIFHLLCKDPNQLRYCDRSKFAAASRNINDNNNDVDVDVNDDDDLDNFLLSLNRPNHGMDDGGIMASCVYWLEMAMVTFLLVVIAIVVFGIFLASSDGADYNLYDDDEL